MVERKGRKKNGKERIFFNNFPSQHLVDAAASFKDSSSRCTLHDRFVVSASSRSGPLVDTSIGTSAVASPPGALWLLVSVSSLEVLRLHMRLQVRATSTLACLRYLLLIAPKIVSGTLQLASRLWLRVLRLLSMRIPTSTRISSTSLRFWSLIDPRIVRGTWQWSSRLLVDVLEKATHATAGESERIRGSRVSGSSFCMCTNSSNSSGCVVGVPCTRAPAVLGVSASASSFASAPASFAVVAHARSTPMHDAHKSWSDTGRSSRCTGGLLPV